MQYRTDEVIKEGREEEKVELRKEEFAPDDYDSEKFVWEEKPLKPGFARPVMVHRAILGSIERFVCILVESSMAKFPF